jgi:hypothetical protein
VSAHDESHGHEETGGFTDDPRAASVIFSGVVGILVLTITILAVEALVYQYEARENRAKNLDLQWTERVRLASEQETNLHRFRWIDKEKGVTGIPIDNAIGIVAREHSR